MQRIQLEKDLLSAAYNKSMRIMHEKAVVNEAIKENLNSYHD